jgi:hypothetical protein
MPASGTTETGTTPTAKTIIEIVTNECLYITFLFYFLGIISFDLILTFSNNFQDKSIICPDQDTNIVKTLLVFVLIAFIICDKHAIYSFYSSCLIAFVFLCSFLFSLTFHVRLFCGSENTQLTCMLLYLILFIFAIIVSHKNTYTVTTAIEV